MLILNNNKLAAPIYKKSLSLLIGKDFAEKNSGKISLSGQQDSEQVNRRRELLTVEEENNQNKIIEDHDKNNFRKKVMDQLFAKINERMDNQLTDTDNLFKEVLPIKNTAPDVLEILNLRAASIKRIAPLVKLLPWLSNELITLVNKPQYRKRADVQVTDPSLALSYIGIDNLQQVIPTFILKQILPHSTSPFTLLKRKLWNESLAIGLASATLAEEAGLDRFTAFTAGMFSNIGRLVITRCYLQAYEELHQAELKQAYENQDQNTYNALIKSDSSPELLLEQFIARSDKVTADIVELMGFDRLQITKPIIDLANASEYKEMCPIAQVVAKAKTYVAFRSLVREQLITKSEVKVFLTRVKMTQKCVDLLKKSDIDHIKLRFN